MRNSIQKLAIAGVALVFGCVLVSTAEASHGKYAYQGSCHDFHGESHVVQALSLMDEALIASCRRDRIHTTLAAQREVMTAFREFCDRTAKQELIQAKIDLSRYIGHGDLCYLDRAAEHLNAALVIEQGIHVHQPVHVGHSQGRPGHGSVQAFSPHRRYSAYSGQRGGAYIRFGGSSCGLRF